ncbi:hypothetical protein BKA63DRAFT_500823 [Paraphoma chrysanthemicola]|nr:hypothetical protein BKA63DRAFT_500823 [Paraphoma chrysanthemicola]
MKLFCCQRLIASLVAGRILSHSPHPPKSETYYCSPCDSLSSFSSLYATTKKFEALTLAWARLRGSRTRCGQVIGAIGLDMEVAVQELEQQGSTVYFAFVPTMVELKIVCAIHSSLSAILYTT